MRQMGAANIQSASFVELRPARKYCKTISHILRQLFTNVNYVLNNSLEKFTPLAGVATMIAYQVQCEMCCGRD